MGKRGLERLPFPSFALVLILANGAFSMPNTFQPIIIGSNLDSPQASNQSLQWWQQSVVYQIYPRSFQDSDGDGIGDLNGITSKLDYFVDLGIDTIWISPFLKSPMKDFGYDISDFRNIDPIFGTMEDFKKMEEEFKKRGLKLVMDMVPNHSSDLHEWFQKSVDRIEPYTGYYVWRNASGTDAQGKPKPPNNWVSVFGGSAWEWNEKRQQFYLHQFVKEQPDLDYNNILVRNEILAVIKFWLDQGVDGFRVDAVCWIYEDDQELDEPVNPNRPPGSLPDEHRYWDHIYTYNQPKTLEFLADLRQLIDIYSAADGKQRVVMIEAGVDDKDVPKYYGTVDKPVSHFPFNFRLLNGINPQLKASEALALIDVWFNNTPAWGWPTFLIGNHDQKRAPTRWTEKGMDGANMINLLLKGTAVTYYGEELGMEDTFLTWEETVDPQACNTDPDRYHEFSRDPARTPMQWNNGTAAGFSSNNKTWLPINPDYLTINVAAEEAASESHLKVYKEILKLRNSNVWRFGDYESRTLNNDRVLGFTRIAPKDVDQRAFLVLVNFSDQSATVDATVFKNVPPVGFVLIRSVDFENQSATVGSSINHRSVILGARDSIVIQFSSPI